MCNQTIFRSKLVEKGIKKKTNTFLERDSKLFFFFNEKGALLDRYIKMIIFFWCLDNMNIILLYVKLLVRAAWRTAWRAHGSKMSVWRVKRIQYEPICNSI